jgi:ubiquinone biosynthesis protein Coq4
MTPTQLSNFYTNDINSMSLAKALDEHYKINPQFTPWDQFDTPEARNLIKSHDISHLIYGCDTSYGGEYCVQTWNKFGSNLNIKPQDGLKYLMNKDLRSLVLPTSLISYALSHIMKFIKLRGQIKNQAKLMTKKWEYFQEELYMNKTIGEIRAEYGIEILR